MQFRPKPTADDAASSVPAPVPPGNAASRSAFFGVFPSIALPMFLAVVDQTIVATALPAIAGALGGYESISWIVIGYLITATIAAPVYGQLGDTFGRKRLMLIALVVMTLASGLCAVAGDMPTLIIGRMLQGLGGGGLMALSQAMIGEALPPRDRIRYQGYLATIGVSAHAFGPLAGAILTEQFGWQSVFLANLPLGIVAILLLLRLPSRPGPGAIARFDFPGLGIFAVFITTTLLALEQVKTGGVSGTVAMLALGALALLTGALFFVQERRAGAPLLPLQLLRHAVIWRADAMAACHGAMLVSLLTFLPIHLRVVRGASAAEIGFILVPLMVGVATGSFITSRFVVWTGRTAIFPSLGLALAVILISSFAFWSDTLGLVEIGVLMGLLGLSAGTVMNVVQIIVQISAGAGMLGRAAASVQLSRSLGAAFGTAIVSTVLAASVADGGVAGLLSDMLRHGGVAPDSMGTTQLAALQADLAAAFRNAFLAIAGFAAIGMALAWMLPTRRL